MYHRSGITAEEFVTIWQTSTNLDEVLERTGMSYEAIMTRAHKYRTERGIPLKRFYRKNNITENLEELIELAKKLEEGK